MAQIECKKINMHIYILLIRENNTFVIINVLNIPCGDSNFHVVVIIKMLFYYLSITLHGVDTTAILSSLSGCKYI